jgi:hypothetical protein
MTPPTKLAVSDALNEQNMLLNELHQVISNLSDRLEPILGLSSPGVACGKDASVSPNKIIHQVGHHNTVLRDARARLVDLLERIEL